MSSFLSMGAVGFTAIAVASVSVVPLILLMGWQRTPSDHEWRDRAPWLIRWTRPILRLFAFHGMRWLGEARHQHIRSRLEHGGIAYCVTPAEFVVLRIVTALSGTALAGLVALIWHGNLQDSWLSVLIGLLLGALYPDLWLSDRIKARRRSMDKDFPFFIDVVVLCMDAGLTFVAAVDHAVGRLPQGDLQHEVHHFMREVRTGLSRRAALENMSRRIDMPAVSNFVASVVEAEETGGSVGAVLKDQASQRRSERFLRAEEAANKAPVKLLFPLVAFLFPVTFVIVGFPIVVEIVQSGSVSFFR